jgi:hypothetical protein
MLFYRTYKYFKYLPTFCGLVLIFLCLNCKQNLNQSGSTGETQNTPPETPADVDPGSLLKKLDKKHATGASNTTQTDAPPFGVNELQGKHIPVVIYGSVNPTYISLKKGEKGWSANFVKDNLEDPGMNDLSIPVEAEKGIEFQKEEMNKYGIYRGKFPAKQIMKICGTGPEDTCEKITHREIIAFKTPPASFEELYKNAKPITDKIDAKAWSLYFLDPTVSIFESSASAMLTLVDKDCTEIEWNNALNKDEKVDLQDSGLELRIMDFEQPILVGKYKLGEKIYNVIGISRVEMETADPA